VLLRVIINYHFQAVFVMLVIQQLQVRGEGSQTCYTKISGVTGMTEIQMMKLIYRNLFTTHLRQKNLYFVTCRMVSNKGLVTHDRMLNFV